MWIHLLLQNLRFSTYSFGTLVLAATAWLYFDSTSGSGVRKFKDWLRILGFWLLSVQFALESVRVVGLNWAFWSQVLVGWYDSVLLGVSVAGGILIVVSFLLDPLIPKPKLAAVMVAGWPPELALPFIWALVALSYLRRASLGLERHLYRPAIAFIFLSLAGVLAWHRQFVESSSVMVASLSLPFGLLWNSEIVAVFVAMLFLASWVFSYLLKRFETQLVLVISMIVLSVYLLMTLCFSGVLLWRLQRRSIGDLLSQSRLVMLTIGNKQSELEADAAWLAENQQVVDGIGSVDKSNLFSFAQSYLLAHKASGVLVIGADGQVLVRGEDRDRVGDSLSDDPVFKKALAGSANSSILKAGGGLTDSLRLVSAAPIKVATGSAGVVMVYSDLDSGYANGLKNVIGSDVLIYSETSLSATSVTDKATKMPLTNLEMKDRQIVDQVINKGEEYAGGMSLLSSSYLSGFEPIKDGSGQTVGMVAVVESEQNLLGELAQATFLTFGLAWILLLLSELPAFLIARSITKQLS